MYSDSQDKPFDSDISDKYPDGSKEEKTNKRRIKNKWKRNVEKKGGLNGNLTQG